MICDWLAATLAIFHLFTLEMNDSVRNFYKTTHDMEDIDDFKH